MSLIDKMLKWEKRILVTLALPLLINTVSIPITIYINSKIDNKKKTAVFTSGYDQSNLPSKVVSGLNDFFMYIFICSPVFIILEMIIFFQY